jgi:hypothetical protein
VRDEAFGAGGGEEVMVTAMRAPPPPVPPVAIRLKPEPIKTQARLYVTYAILP